MIESKEKEKVILRSLSAYKELHKDLAERNGVHNQLLTAHTLTKARKILFGLKQKNQTHLGRGT